MDYHEERIILVLFDNVTMLMILNVYDEFDFPLRKGEKKRNVGLKSNRIFLLDYEKNYEVAKPIDDELYQLDISPKINDLMN